jgi:ribosomal protein S18 acetylase RimI-like enzyme
LEAAADLYASAGLPMVFRITPYTCPSDQDAALAGLGFARMDETCVMARWLPTGYAATAPLPGGTHGSTLSMADVARVLADMRQSPPHQEAGHLQRLQTSPVPYRAWAIRRDGDAEVMACGQWAQEGPMAGLYDVHTREAHRDRGLAKALCDQMLAQAAAHGATLAYLQVEGSNHTARRVYESLGFVAAYTYHYRQKL